MAILRYTASADTTITDALKFDMSTKATGSNMGSADSLQIFSIYGQASGSSGMGTTVEKSRTLVNFSSSVAQIMTDRAASTIPASGSVSFYLRMFNARTPFTLPDKFTLVAHPISRSWDEGYGLDMDTYIDSGYANWIAASSASSGITDWTTQGGDYHTGSYVAGSTLPFYSQYFKEGTEDLEIDITSLVEEWVASNGSDARANYGVGVFLTSSQEDGSEKRSYYIKKFYARGTEYYFKRPLVEARWDDSKKDDRGDFYLSSSLAPAADNLNKLYLYNYVKGQLKNIPALGAGTIFVSIYSGTTAPTSEKLQLPAGGGVVSAADLNITASFVSTGIYSASFATTSSVSSTEYLFDVWHRGGTEYFTGSAISPKSLAQHNNNVTNDWVTTITNLKTSYSTTETARFRVFTRTQNWSPTIYSKATTAIKPVILRDAYYRIYRVSDNLEAIGYGSGSVKHTQLSYDASGSYFDLKMDLFEPGYAYGIKILSNDNGATVEHPETFKFRVE